MTAPPRTRHAVDPSTTAAPATPARRHLLALAGAAACLPRWAPAQSPPAAGPRVALVIGNAAYAQAPLLNPLNDARAMAERLRALGFEVVAAADARRDALRAALSDTTRRLQGRGGTGLVYFAGHGVQIDWRNYLLPVDTTARDAAELARQALDVQELLDALRAAGTLTQILVLDACRDNPFGERAGPRGLAPLDAPPGSFLAYATAPGNVAEDGSAADGHGLYTGHLLRELAQPGQPIETVFKRVRYQVRRDSEGRQIPWESTSLEDDFYFAGRPPDDDEGDDAVERRETAAEAAVREQSEAWTALGREPDARRLTEFLLRHPDGPWAEQAQYRLDQLQGRTVVAQPRRDAPPTLAPGAWRYRVGDELHYETTGAAPRERPLAGRLARGGEREPAPRQGVTLRVTAADAERVSFNGGQVVATQLGTVLQEGGLRKVPGHVKVPSELHVGRRWSCRFDVFDSTTGALKGKPQWQYRVAALETVQVGAGRFQAWRIEGQGSDTAPEGLLARVRRRLKTLEHTLWVDSATLVIVREELHRRFDGQRRRAEVRELVRLRQVPRP